MKCRQPDRVRATRFGRFGQSFLQDIETVLSPVPGGGSVSVPGRATQYVTDTGVDTTDPSQQGGANESWVSYTTEGLAAGAASGVVDAAAAAAKAAAAAAGTGGLVGAGVAVAATIALVLAFRGRKHGTA
jgi:hypothetical protein